MAAAYDVSIKVISQKGTCDAGHKVGEEWIVKKDDVLAPRLCIGAYAALHPYLVGLMFGGSYPWEDDQDVARLACPDPNNPVVFELRRLRE
jgi:uncharacterized repeat protein (TIGR04076 family)